MRDGNASMSLAASVGYYRKPSYYRAYSWRSPLSTIKVVDDGLLSSLAALRVTWLPSLSFGLYQNDLTPEAATTIAEIDPCTFSGYVGLQLAAGWSLPVIDGARAVSLANLLTWTHNGGVLSNWVFGFYVVDGIGDLVLAQRFEDAPKLMEYNGVALFVHPTFSVRSEF